MKGKRELLLFPRKKKRNRDITSRGLFIKIGISLMLFLLVILGYYSYRVQQLQAELKENEEKVTAREEKGEELEKEIRQLEQEEYIEKLARRRLGLVKPGETIIIIED